MAFNLAQIKNCRITMNTRLIFLGVLSFIIGFYLKIQADGFGLPDGSLTQLEQSQKVLHYVFSILAGILGLGLFYLAWKPPLSIRPNILSQGATAVYLLLLLVFIAINYTLGFTLDNG